jgi:hypothetical protein
MHNIQRYYRLVHLDRRVWDCASLTEAMRIIVNCHHAVIGWYLKSYLKGLGDTPFRRVHDSMMALEWERHYNFHHWIILDETGTIMPRWQIDAGLQREGFRFSEHPRDYRRSGDWSRYRGHSGIGARCHRASTRYWRQPRNIAQKRARERSEDDLYEYGFTPPRRKYIPSNYDDIRPGADRNRNWKRHRQKQYRS